MMEIYLKEESGPSIKLNYREVGIQPKLACKKCICRWGHLRTLIILSLPPSPSSRLTCTRVLERILPLLMGTKGRRTRIIQQTAANTAQLQPPGSTISWYRSSIRAGRVE